MRGADDRFLLPNGFDLDAIKLHMDMRDAGEWTGPAAA
jgi:hypothetical protein